MLSDGRNSHIHFLTDGPAVTPNWSRIRTSAPLVITAGRFVKSWNAHDELTAE